MNIEKYIKDKNLKEPKKFNDILKLQGILDSKINNIRKRGLSDIRISMIAELVEFNEETKFSHKTWKTKEYNKDKELEELVDVWFFFAQMVNFRFKNNRECKLHISELGEMFDKEFNFYRFSYENEDTSNSLFLELMSFTTFGDNLSVLKRLIKISAYFSYTREYILKGYWKKWKKNMGDRIGKEWN